MKKIDPILNYLAVIVFPAVGTLYFTLAQIWGLPAAEQVIGSIVAVDAFLGVLVKYRERKYDGAIEITQNDEKLLYSINLAKEPEDLIDKKKVTFEIQAHPSIKRNLAAKS